MNRFQIQVPDGLEYRKLPRAAEMVALDAGTISSGTPSSILMQRAGEAAVNVLKRRGLLKSDIPICILCGPGNNGGDGLVMARLISGSGFKVKVIAVEAPKYSSDFLEQLAKLPLEVGVYPKVPTVLSEIKKIGLGSVSDAELTEILSVSGLWIDSLLGTGQSRAPNTTIATILNLVSETRSKCSSNKVCVSVDLPTGVNTDTGEVFEPHFRADLTVCIQLVKRGLTQSPGREICGELEAVDIGIDCSSRVEFELSDEMNLPRLRSRSWAAHKGNFGKVLVIGGSANMPGAPLLSAEAALRGGAGLVTIAHRDPVLPRISSECLLARVIDNPDHWTAAGAALLRTAINQANAVVLGPGMGTEPDTAGAVKYFLGELAQRKIPTIIDADGLNHLAGLFDHAEIALPPSVLTPHPGEMGRLLGISSAEVQKNRFECAKKLAQKANSVVVLKGAGTIVYAGTNGWVNLAGTPFLATPGSGDVLAGLIACFIAQGFSLVEAARLGVYAHAKAGELAVENNSGGPIIAGDIIAAIPKTLGGMYV